MRKSLKCPVRIVPSPASCIIFAAALLLLSGKILLSWLFAVVIHECSHILVIRILRKRIIRIHVGMTGMKIYTEPLSHTQELLCAAAGPAGSLLLLFVMKWMPLAALFGTVQGLYNLLPLYPMDGGRILRILCEDSFGMLIGEKVSEVMEWTVIILILLAAIYIAIMWRYGILAVMGMIPLALKIKSSCKQGREGVQ